MQKNTFLNSNTLSPSDKKLINKNKTNENEQKGSNNKLTYNGT